MKRLLGLFALLAFQSEVQAGGMLVIITERHEVGDFAGRTMLLLQGWFDQLVGLVC